MGIQDILGKSASTIAIDKTFKEYTKTSMQLTSNRKYSNLAEVVGAGLMPTIEEQRHILTNTDSDQRNQSQRRLCLEQIKNLIGQLQDVVTRLTQDRIRIDPSAPTSVVIANTALAEIEKILNTRTDGGSNSFLFGGIREDQPPISVDLTAISNLVNNLPTTNYTNASYSTDTVYQISEAHVVPTNLLCASDFAIQNLIGTCNILKQEPVNPTPQQKQDIDGRVDALLRSVKQGLSSLEEKTLAALDSLEKASEYSMEQAAAAQDKLCEFLDPNVIECSTKLQDLNHAFSVALNVQTQLLALLRQMYHPGN